MSATLCPTTPGHLRKMAEELRNGPGGLGEIIDTLESLATWLAEQPSAYCPFAPGDLIGWISRRGLQAVRAGASPTIHARQGLKHDLPVYLGRVETLTTAPTKVAKAVPPAEPHPHPDSLQAVLHRFRLSAMLRFDVQAELQAYSQLHKIRLQPNATQA